MSRVDLKQLVRYVRAFQGEGAKPRKLPEKLDQYTNLSHRHVWDRIDCQEQLLIRESLIPLQFRSPRLLDLIHARQFYHLKT